MYKQHKWSSASLFLLLYLETLEILIRGTIADNLQCMPCRQPFIDALDLPVYKASCSTDEHHIFLPQLRLCCQLPVRHALQFAGQQ